MATSEIEHVCAAHRVDHDQAEAVGRVEGLVPAGEAAVGAGDLAGGQGRVEPERGVPRGVEGPGHARLVIGVEEDGRLGLEKQAAHRPVGGLGRVAQEPADERPPSVGPLNAAEPVVDGQKVPLEVAIAIGQVGGEGEEVAVVPQRLGVGPAFADPSDDGPGERIGLLGRQDVGEPLLGVEPDHGLEPAGGQGDGAGEHRRRRSGEDHARRRRPQRPRHDEARRSGGRRVRRGPRGADRLDRPIPALLGSERGARPGHPNDPRRLERPDEPERRLDLVEEDREVMLLVPRGNGLEVGRQVGDEADLVDDLAVRPLPSIPEREGLVDRVEPVVEGRQRRRRNRQRGSLGRRGPVAKHQEPQEPGEPPASDHLSPHGQGALVVERPIGGGRDVRGWRRPPAFVIITNPGSPGPLSRSKMAGARRRSPVQGLVR
jgi:hypothetical protein